MQYPLLLPPWIWLLRFPHRCGYGVHSPYAFEFITGVIYEKGAYYAYWELDRQLPWYARTPHWLPWPFRTACLRPQRILHLLFRLANFSEAREVLAIRMEELPYTYMRAALPNARWHTEMEEGGTYGLVYIGGKDEKTRGKSSPKVEAQAIPSAPLVIIDRLRCHKALFDELKADKETTLTFDLYDVGIVMRGLPLNRMDYIVNF